LRVRNGVFLPCTIETVLIISKDTVYFLIPIHKNAPPAERNGGPSPMSMRPMAWHFFCAKFPHFVPTR